MEVVKLTVILQIITACTYGEYLVELRVISYTNPSNWCAECSTSSPFEGQFGCCDNFDEQDCQGIAKCDNYFRYCLRELGTIDQITQLRASDQPTGCLSGTLIQSNFPDEVDFNTDTDFSGSQVLGLANPLPLFGQGNQWQGIQVYIEPMDFDEDSSDDTIDILTIDLPPSIEPGSSGNNIQLTGRFGIAIMNISYQVKCQRFFYGIFCENFDNCMAARVICENGGTCRDLDNNYQCECTPGYFGQFCEEIDNCFGVSCSNRGQCRNGICECDPGYTGRLCETEANECLGVDCNGRGTCENRVNSSFCTCDQGYTGPLCETDIDDCEGITCSGNGQCIDGTSTFTCLCYQGFTGSVCDILLDEQDECEGITCSGNGQCIDGISTFICQCDQGFTGSACDIPLDEQDECEGITCSENGQCIDGESAVTCLCNPGFTGDLCEIELDMTNAKVLRIVGALIGVLIILTVLGIIAGILTWAVIQHKRKKEPDLDGRDDHIYANPTVPKPRHYVNVRV